MNAEISLNDRNLNSSEGTADKKLKAWSDINWQKAERFVNRLQIRIAKATASGDLNFAKRLGYLLTHSFYAKALAIKSVCSNKGKNTPGIDGVIWKTDAEKLSALSQLDDKNYTPRPLRRVYIEKYGKKEKRPLSIPTMRDRAMQTLYKVAMDPIAETNADNTSFGFRRFRGPHNAMQYAFTLLSRRYSPQWVLEGDIKGCFDNISHTWLLENAPMDKGILQKFLKSGFVFRKELFPTEIGTPQGGTISPTLANLTLDGMEQVLRDRFWRNKKGTYSIRNNTRKVHLVRFADDFIVTADTRETAIEAKGLIQQFLETRGLVLSESKTSITQINEGFDFLGWEFKKYGSKLIIQPSRQSIFKITQNVRKVIRQHQASSQEDLIRKLNPIMSGWANYHQPVCASQAYKRVDFIIWDMLWSWAKRRHPNKGNRWVYSRYWQRYNGTRLRFWSDQEPLISMSETPIVRRQNIRLDMNPYLNVEYYENLQAKEKAKRRTAKYGEAACPKLAGLYV